MKRTLLVSLILLIAACGKDKDKTVPPGDDGGGDDAANNDEPFVPDVPQEPDPPAIADGRKQCLLGNYEDAIKTLAPLYDDLKARKQYRASGLAGGWLAVAHAQVVHENADEPSQHAVNMGDKTHDKEVIAVAKIARGTFLLRQEDFAAAEQSFAAAIAAESAGTPAAVAALFRGEALIGSAFGGGDSNTLERPQDLDQARTAYEAALAAAKDAPDAEVLLGRAEEGLAGIAKYKHDKKAICEHAFNAIDHYKAAGASEFLLDGPNRLATDEKCEAES